MTYDQAQVLILPSIVLFGTVCLAVGYWAGASRAFYATGRLGEGLLDILRTLRPYAGNKRNAQYKL